MGPQSIESMASTKVVSDWASILKSHQTTDLVMQVIDQDLRRVCEELIQTCSVSATSSLFDATRSSSPTPARISTFQDTAKQEIQGWVASLRLYLEDPRTVAILVAPMQANVMREYLAFLEKAAATEGAEGVLSTVELWGLLKTWCEEPASV